jgi:hypothetical protein
MKHVMIEQVQNGYVVCVYVTGAPQATPQRYFFNVKAAQLHEFLDAFLSDGGTVQLAAEVVND